VNDFPHYRVSHHELERPPGLSGSVATFLLDCYVLFLHQTPPRQPEDLILMHASDFEKLRQLADEAVP
jgi:hypothetical protein